mgnify:CR=1 FL=1
MKSIIKLTCIMMALLSMLVIAGCSNKPDYTGTWIGYDGENALYRLTIQENGKEYMVTEDTYFYIPEKDLPKPNLFALFVTANDNLPNANNKYDIKYILHKDSRVTTANEDQYKNQLSYDEGRTMLRYIEKDKTLLLNNIRYQKETSDLTNSFLQQMQAAMRRELELKYHKYGERAIGSNHNKVILGNITFDDSALTENK